MRRGLSIVGVAVVAFAMGFATASGLGTARGDVNVKDLKLDFSPDEISIEVLEHARKRPFVLGWSDAPLPRPGDFRLLPPEGGPIRIERKPPKRPVIHAIVPEVFWDEVQQLWRPCDPAICTPVPRGIMRESVQEFVPQCITSTVRETNCTNGRDDDCDGATDGADKDCPKK